MTQIANTLDIPSLKNTGISLLKTVVAALITAVIAFLGSNIEVIAGAFKNPTVSVVVVILIRGLMSLYTEYKSGQVQ